MIRIQYYLALVCSLLLFFLGGQALDLLGWAYTSSSGSAITKIHPVTYIAAIGALAALLSLRPVYWRYVVSLPFLLFILAAAGLIYRAISIQKSGEIGGGEASGAIVTWITPALILIILQAVQKDQFNRLAATLRVFFVVNSVMALAERLVGHRFVPGFLDLETGESRATALLGHPLNGALLTGLLIVALVTAPRRGITPWIRLPEISLHMLAMFAFGGRSALILTPFILVISAVFGRQRNFGRGGSFFQRAIPLAAIAAGIMLLFLKVPFVDETLNRFTQDTRSSGTRDASIKLLNALTSDQLRWGADLSQRTILQTFFGLPHGIELAWISMAVTYGLVATIPVLIALPLLLFSTSSKLDRSAFYMTVLFLVVTGGSLSIASKSLLVAQMIVMIYVLCQLPEVIRVNVGDLSSSEQANDIAR